MTFWFLPRQVEEPEDGEKLPSIRTTLRTTLTNSSGDYKFVVASVKIAVSLIIRPYLYSIVIISKQRMISFVGESTYPTCGIWTPTLLMVSHENFTGLTQTGGMELVRVYRYHYVCIRQVANDSDRYRMNPYAVRESYHTLPGRASARVNVKVGVDLLYWEY